MIYEWIGNEVRFNIDTGSIDDNADSDALDAVYRSMDGWQGYDEDGIPAWIVDGTKIQASFELSGILLEVERRNSNVDGWLESLSDSFRVHLRPSLLRE